MRSGNLYGGVQCVQVGHPPNQPRVLGQWDHRVAADTAQEGRIAQHHSIIAQHHSIIAILANHCTLPIIAQDHLILHNSYWRCHSSVVLSQQVSLCVLSLQEELYIDPFSRCMCA